MPRRSTSGDIAHVSANRRNGAIVKSADTTDQPEIALAGDERRYSREWIEAHIDSIDWAATSLGRRSDWPAGLEHVLGMCLGAAHATAIYWGPDLIQFHNGALARLCGERHPAALGRPMRETWSDIWPTIGPQLERVLTTGETTISDNLALEPGTKEGAWEDRFFTYAYSPIRIDGLIVGVMDVVVETTDVVRQQREITAFSVERQFLAEASRLLAESLDVKETLQNLAQLIVPGYADWCQIDLRSRTNALETVAAAHCDPHKHSLLQNVVGRTHLNTNGAHGSPLTVRTGKTDLIATMSQSILAETVGEAAEIAFYEMLGTRSVASFPISAEGKTFGAISIVYGESGRCYSRDDVPLMEELGRRAGVAVRNARLFEREHRTAELFQESSLPTSLPTIAGFTFDAVYQAGRTGRVAGGDWYDAVRLFDGRVVISIGDVAGSGLRAAITMGNIRQIIRGIAQVHADPALMLDAADRALRIEYPDVFATAFVAVLDPLARTVNYASAGHPPPMFCAVDGRVTPLLSSGLPLGLRHTRDSANSATVDFPAGSRLVLYTDGLTEFKRDALAGENRLREILETAPIFDATHPAARLQEIFLDGEITNDDVAVLTVCSVDAPISPTGLSPFIEWRFDIHNAQAAQNARREFCSALEARGAGAEATAAAELVFGELVGNVMRYAPGHVQIMIDMSTAAPVLHVLDQGPGFAHIPILPADVYAESGRGLYLVSALTQDFHVAKRPHGGSHARAVLSLERSIQ